LPEEESAVITTIRPSVLEDMLQSTRDVIERCHRAAGEIQQQVAISRAVIHDTRTMIDALPVQLTVQSTDPPQG
jgi:hypothetical protein